MKRLIPFSRLAWYYLTWLPVLRWVSITGLALLALTLALLIIGLLTGQDIEIRPTGGIGLVMALGAPIMTSGLAFRKLAAASQFALAPGATLKACQVLLVLTGLAALLPVLFISHISSQAINTGMMMALFSLGTLVIGLAQLNLPVWLGVFIGWTPLFFLEASRRLPEGYFAPLVSTEALSLYLAVSIVGWIRALVIAAQGHRLSPTRMSSRPVFRDAWEMRYSTEWLRFIQGRYFTSATDSLYYNMYINGLARLKRQMWPMLAALVLALFFYFQQEKREQLLKIITFLGVMMPMFSMYAHMEILPRSRLLWLHLDADRRAIWHIAETNMKKELLLMLTFMLLVLGGVLLLGGSSLTVLAGVLAAAVGGGLFFCYLPLYCRMRQGIEGTVLLVSLSVVASIAEFIIMAKCVFDKQVMPGLVLGGVLMALAWVFRTLTIRLFDRVDWLAFRPSRIARRRNAT